MRDVADPKRVTVAGTEAELEKAIALDPNDENARTALAALQPPIRFRTPADHVDRLRWCLFSRVSRGFTFGRAGKPQPPNEAAKLRKFGKRVESRVGLQENEARIALFVGFFEPVQRLLVVSQRDRSLSQE